MPTRTISRRQFVRQATALAALGVAAPARSGAASAPVNAPRTVVVVFLVGGADGVSLVVPHAEAGYYRARPTIAIPRPGTGHDACLDLDGFFGFHPALAPLVPWYRAARLRVVHACGLPDAPAAHLGARERLHTFEGSDLEGGSDGWLHGHLTATRSANAAAVRAIAMCSMRPRCLDGSSPTALIGPDGTVMLAPGRDAGLAWADRDPVERQRRELAAIVASGGSREAAVSYPATPFGRALSRSARVARAQVGIEAIVVESLGWDTHVAQGGASGPLGDRADELARGLAAFLDDLAETGSEVLVIVLTEFGRAIAENRYGGTDHGRGCVLFAIGDAVDGGRVAGRWPGIGEPAPAGGLPVTTDVQHVVGELLVRLPQT